MIKKREKTCLLIDIDIPDDSNVNTTEIEKLTKYKDLDIEIRRMWKVRTKIMPVIIADSATIKKQNLQLLPGQLLAIDLQKITLMSMVHVICKVLGKSI
jgi:hypothetical protein